MKHIAGWFRRNNTIMAQAKDLSRQLQEAWDDHDIQVAVNEEIVKLHRYKVAKFEEEILSWGESCGNLQYQLHRVARERDQEREKRLAAEDALFDMYLDDGSIEPFAMTPKEVHDSYLENADNEEE